MCVLQQPKQHIPLWKLHTENCIASRKSNGRQWYTGQIMLLLALQLEHIYVLKPFCATRSFQHIMPLLKAHYYTQRGSQKILQLRGSLGPSAGN